MRRFKPWTKTVLVGYLILVAFAIAATQIDALAGRAPWLSWTVTLGSGLLVGIAIARTRNAQQKKRGGVAFGAVLIAAGIVSVAVVVSEASSVTAFVAPAFLLPIGMATWLGSLSSPVDSSSAATSHTPWPT